MYRKHTITIDLTGETEGDIWDAGDEVMKEFKIIYNDIPKLEIDGWKHGMGGGRGSILMDGEYNYKIECEHLITDIEQQVIKGWHVMTGYEAQSRGYKWIVWVKPTPFRTSPPCHQEQEEKDVWICYGDSRQEAIDLFLESLDKR